MTAQKIIITLGILFIIIGMLFPYISKLGLGKLPGDIYFWEQEFKVFLSTNHYYFIECFNINYTLGLEEILND